MRVVTLTLNPAFDVHCRAENFLPNRENIVEICSEDAGGKGINISRALSLGGVENTAVAVLGKENGSEFFELLTESGQEDFKVIYTKGRIRENITIHEAGKPETRISFGGFEYGRDVLSRVFSAIGAPASDMIITMTGSIPKGLCSGDVLGELTPYKEAGALVVIDSRSVSLSDIIDFKPWLIKPNRDEIEGYIGRRIASPRDAADVARELCRLGVENVLISLGGEGAVFANSALSLYAECPRIDVRSTIGAGDSSIAGYICGFCRGYSEAECLKLAVSFGTAACLTEGTMPPSMADAEEIFARTEIFVL